MSDCIFCQICQHQLPAKIVFEDEALVVFHDIKPKAKIHLLLAPKKHLASLNATEEEDLNLLGKLLWQAKEIAKELNLQEQGYKVIINCGRNAGQIVDHLHCHLLSGGLTSFVV